MALISRAAKAGSGTGDYAAGTTISSSEVNADINTAYNEINGNLNSANLATNAVTTAKITDSNVTEAKIANLAVTTDKIAIGDTVRGVLLANVNSAVSVSNDATETTLVTFASFTSGGGWIEFGGAWGASYIPEPDTTSYYVIRLYRGATVVQRIRVTFPLVNATVPGIFPIPSWIEQPGAGAYVYTVTAQLVASPSLIGSFATPATDPGTCWLRETA
jgi:hypothetical protein